MKLLVSALIIAIGIALSGGVYRPMNAGGRLRGHEHVDRRNVYGEVVLGRAMTASFAVGGI
jgi:hypothetical protein